MADAKNSNSQSSPGYVTRFKHSGCWAIFSHIYKTNAMCFSEKHYFEQSSVCILAFSCWILNFKELLTL
jgi:hypothetical protein